MLEPLVPPESQFCDANGVPFAGGTIDVYIPGTDTRRDTWRDLEGTALNENPIVLDSAGRALIYGAGDYRWVLKDAAGNLIWDQETSAIDKSTLVTMTEVNDAVQAETDRAEAAEAAETARAEAAEASLRSDLNAEIARAEAAEANLQSQIDGLSSGTGTTTAMQAGENYTNSSGVATVSFATPYPSGYNIIVVATPIGPGADVTSVTIVSSTSGFELWAAFPSTGGVTPTGIQGFYWMAMIQNS